MLARCLLIFRLKIANGFQIVCTYKPLLYPCIYWLFLILPLSVTGQ